MTGAPLPPPPDDALYEPRFVRALFDEMAETYGVINLVSSFGFAARWRKQCVRALGAQPGWSVLDLMTGMGELCPDLARAVGPAGSIRAVDLSPEMCRRAARTAARCACRTEVLEADALLNDIPPASADAVVSSFGLKTFSADQTRRLAGQVAVYLKPGGRFAFVEISVPPGRWLRRPYLFYLNRVIPLVGRVLLGNPDNYRMLGVYTERFGDCGAARREFELAGLVTEERSYFFGCATGLCGYKPA
ncbi:MAG TPA: class I SAM-dependent methyltransferase [Urbifossiella sp.]|nr:class I SAM-dependent methyltransferase [Urbifossiella sp.]